MSEIHQVALLAEIITSAMAASFTILLISKIGLREELIIESPRLMSKMFNCDFCLSFWTNLTIGLCLFCTMGNTDWLVTSIFATPITRLFI